MSSLATDLPLGLDAMTAAGRWLNAPAEHPEGAELAAETLARRGVASHRS